MIDGRRVLALVAARGGSKGLPRKNLRLLGGRPLVAWPVSTALAARSVDRVAVSTDDEEIAAAARAAGADVPFMRPAALASDSASSIAVALHALELLAAEGHSYDYLVLLEPTSPLTEPQDVDRALAILHAGRERADAIVGISRLEASHPDFDVRLGADGLIRPYAAADFSSLKRRQDVEPLYFLEGSLYASAVEVLAAKKSFCHDRTLGYPVPRWKALEIDELIDFICVEALLKHREDLRAAE